MNIGFLVIVFTFPLSSPEPDHYSPPFRKTPDKLFSPASSESNIPLHQAGCQFENLATPAPLEPIPHSHTCPLPPHIPIPRSRPTVASPHCPPTILPPPPAGPYATAPSAAPPESTTPFQETPPFNRRSNQSLRIPPPLNRTLPPAAGAAAASLRTLRCSRCRSCHSGSLYPNSLQWPLQCSSSSFSTTRQYCPRSDSTTPSYQFVQASLSFAPSIGPFSCCSSGGFAPSFHHPIPPPSPTAPSNAPSSSVSRSSNPPTDPRQPFNV
ncbi:hypothetical protein BDZ91DRAFT_512852 [Kalaharituber pfeilii]|nr:hypothetical protein BDZ91DRAFT_512852 [Kalaharituber pfeilii]